MANSNITIDQLADTELIKKYKYSHDKEYVGILFKRYFPLVFGIAQKYTNDLQQSEAITLKAFEVMQEAFKRWEVDAFQNWLHTVTTYLCVQSSNQYYSAFTDESVLVRSKELIPDHAVKDYNSEGSKQKLIKALKQIDDFQRICIYFLYVKNQSLPEISQTTGFRLAQVESIIKNGKHHLKSFLVR